MEACLVSAPVASEFEAPEERSSERVRQETLEPQLGLLTLAAVLESRAHEVRLVDLNRLFYQFVDHNPKTASEDFAWAAASQIAGFDVPLYGFGTICSGYPLTIRIAQALKAIRPEAAILFGGPQASVVDVETLQAFPFVDFILRGESDLSLPLLIGEWESARRLDRIPGLTYRADGEVRRNQDAPLVGNLDDLPAPAYHLTGELEGASIATLELGRGCPYACTFCSTNDFFRRRFRLRSPQRVLADMREIARRYSIYRFELVHDMFTVDRRRVLEFCEAMIASGEGYTWACSARTDRVDRELLATMYRAGCRSIFFGVETGSARMQKAIDKKLDLAQAQENLDLCENLGIGTTVSFIGGFPQETPDDLRATVRMFMRAAAHENSNPQFNLLAPLARTPLHLQYRSEMTLEELCSDMSRQGRAPNREDEELVRRYRDIFPNFYMLPTPYLDREALHELREYLTVAPARFRWLACAIDQTSDFYSFFLRWRACRFHNYGRVSGGALRLFYRTADFVRAHIDFVEGDEVSDAPAVRIFLTLERAMLSPAHSGAVLKGRRLAVDEGFGWGDLAAWPAQMRFIKLPGEIEGAIAAVRTRTKLTQPGQDAFYVAGPADGGRFLLRRISDWTASLLRICEGQCNIERVVEQLSEELATLKEEHRRYACLKLVQGAQAEGLIEIWRTNSEAAGIQPGANGNEEYSERSCIASLENQPFIQPQ